ncbi:unnamed protein product [Leptidea sinapis]|uniref:Uncharacterized protein n=1 Tax=Leptidea sinapis TaxID=189913 RepID=A0A5E4PXH0_9NEOP|nr:unnamed protein product [Leptidea sinapis]
MSLNDQKTKENDNLDEKVDEQATNNAINQNRDEFFIAMKPYLENTAAKVLLDTANKIVHSLTLDDLFPKP